MIKEVTHGDGCHLHIFDTWIVHKSKYLTQTIGGDRAENVSISDQIHFRFILNGSMDATWKNLLWSQFGAALDTVENAIETCPDDLWADQTRRPGFCYLVFHTLIFADLYCSESLAKFAPPAPFSRSELGERGQVFPNRLYTRDELRKYLEYCREKARACIRSLTEEKSRQSCPFPWVGGNNVELILYNMRHVQHHAAQLNLILRQVADLAPRWVFRAQTSL